MVQAPGDVDSETFYQGTLTEGGRLSTVHLLIWVACFVKNKIIFTISKAAVPNKLVYGGQLY
jgi:hypothetical protein